MAFVTFTWKFHPTYRWPPMQMDSKLWLRIGFTCLYMLRGVATASYGDMW